MIKSEEGRAGPIAERIDEAGGKAACAQEDAGDGAAGCPVGISVPAALHGQPHGTGVIAVAPQQPGDNERCVVQRVCLSAMAVASPDVREGALPTLALRVLVHHVSDDLGDPLIAVARVSASFRVPLALSPP